MSEASLSEPILAVDSVRVAFGGNVAVDDVTMHVDDGEIVGIIGPNGAGKSTLLNAISGFVPASGHVTLCGKSLDGLLPYQRARRGLGRSFQDARLYPTMTVRETLISAFHPQQHSGLMSEGLGFPSVRKEAQLVAGKAEQLLGLIDLERYLDYRVSELSFGTTRAVELAWISAMDPAILLLDEPASGLQQSEVRAMGPIIDALRGSASVIVIDHDVPFVSGLSDRMIAIDLGVKIADGTAEEVLGNERVIESYLGAGAYAGSKP